MAAASSLTAELESLQTRTTQTLQQIDENFSKANEVAAELFPLAREFVKQLCLADSESKVWHDAFLEVAGMRPTPIDDAVPQASPPAVSVDAPKTPGKSKGADLDDSDLLGSDLSSVAPRTTGRKTPGMRGGMTLFSPPVSTPFLKAARTPGHVSGYERGGLMEDEDDDAMGAVDSASSTPTMALSMHGSAAAGNNRANVAADHGAGAGTDGPMSAADMDMDMDMDMDDADAPSPDLASPEMPAFSSRAAALLGALGPDPNTTAAVASLRRSRLIAAPALATASAGAQLASSSSVSDSAVVPRAATVSPPQHRPMTMADVAAGGDGSDEEEDTSSARVRMDPGSDDDFAVGDWDEPTRNDDEAEEELGAMLSHLGSPGGIALSRHSLAITHSASVDEDEDEDAQSGMFAAGDGDDAPSLEELTASAVATNLRRSTLAGLPPGLPEGTIENDDDDDDSDDVEPAVLTLSSLGSSSSSSAASQATIGRASRVGSMSRRKSVGVAKHAEEFSLRLFPAMFHSGHAATSLIAVWSVVSGGQDGHTAAAFSAEAIVAALTKQGHERPPSKVKTTAMLQMLASQGFLREFVSKGSRFWRLHVVE